MVLIIRRFCFPRVHDEELDSVEMVPDVHHRVPDQDAITRNKVSTLPNTTEGNNTKQLPSTLTGRPAQEDDVAEEQNPMQNPDSNPVRAPADDVLAPRYICSTVPGIDESSLPRLQHSLVVEPGAPDAINEVQTPNVIIFGEAGVGKSSVINLIAGQKRAHISNDAVGCTFQYQRHIINLNGMPFAFWDTTGLDEESEGTVPAKLAESNLRELIQGLAHSGGVHLVIYCIRGTRLTKVLKHNYDLFYTAVCRKKVSVALVVTGLEHQQGNMETWWDENKAALQRCGMWFNAHACVTTLDVDDAIVQVRRSDSQKRLRDLVFDYGGRRPWKIKASVISWSMFRNVLLGGSFPGRKVTRRAIIYDRTTSCRTRQRLLGEQQLEYELVYTNNPLTHSTSGKQAGALVFYTSPLLNTQMSPEDMDVLKTFYDATGGESCPVIVVLRGCKDDHIAQRCWDAVAPVMDIYAWPIVDEQAKLDVLIEKWCIEHVEAKFSPLHRAYEVLMELVAAMACSFGKMLAPFQVSNDLGKN